MTIPQLTLHDAALFTSEWLKHPFYVARFRLPQLSQLIEILVSNLSAIEYIEIIASTARFD